MLRYAPSTRYAQDAPPYETSTTVGQTQISTSPETKTHPVDWLLHVNSFTYVSYPYVYTKRLYYKFLISPTLKVNIAEGLPLNQTVAIQLI